MKPEMKKLIIANLPYLLFVYLFGKLGQTYRLAAGADLSEKLLHLADGFSLAFESAAPSFHLFDLAVGVAGAVALRLMVYCKSKNAKKYRRGVEYGSARWGGPKDIAPYIDPVFDNNILLTQTERLTMNNRPKDPKTARNKNVLVIGGSGSGKTRFFVKPNLMQCVSKDYPTSFVITDPKGSLIGEVGQLLVRCGYRVKVLNIQTSASTAGKRKKPLTGRGFRALSCITDDTAVLSRSRPPFLFASTTPAPCSGMAALGGSRHATKTTSTKSDRG